MTEDWSRDEHGARKVFWVHLDPAPVGHPDWRWLVTAALVVLSRRRGALRQPMLEGDSE
jgi:hypothetical protein